MKRWLHLIPLLVVVFVEIAAYRYGLLSGGMAVVTFILIEALLVGIILSKDKNHPVRRLMAAELQAWRTLFMLLTRKTEYPPGAIPLFSHQRWYQLPAMLTVAVIIEIIAVELLVPWQWLRILLLLLSIYSLLLLWAMFAGIKVHPSYVYNNALTLRRGRKSIATIPLTHIATITYSRGFDSDLHLAKDHVLTLGGPEGTNVLVTFSQAQPVQATGYFWQHRPMLSIQQCHLWLDQPDNLINLKQP